MSDPRRGPTHPDRPLDALVPGLGPAIEGPRVLGLATPRGYEWALALTHDPGSDRAAHHEAAHLVEGTLLAALCQPPGDEASLNREIVALRLFVFADVPGDLGRAFRAFGLERADVDLAEWREPFEHLTSRGDAQPVSSWSARVDARGSAIGAELSALQLRLMSRISGVWGSAPGEYAAALLSALSAGSGEKLGPDLASLERVEDAIVSRRSGVIRWIPPLVFQALCDLVGVVAVRELGATLEWSVSELEEDGTAPPPVFRVAGETHLPIALHLLRWCVMPLQVGEEVPRLSAWLRAELGNPLEI